MKTECRVSSNRSSSDLGAESSGWGYRHEKGQWHLHDEESGLSSRRDPVLKHGPKTSTHFFTRLTKPLCESGLAILSLLVLPELKTKQSGA